MSHVLAAISAEDIARHRNVLCQWAEANGINPVNIAASPGLTVERTGRRTHIVYREIQRDAEGHAHLDPANPHEMLTIRKATPLISPLEDHGYQDPEANGS